jgi:hypothetical protein
MWALVEGSQKGTSRAKAVRARGHNEHRARTDPSNCLERLDKIQPPTSAADGCSTPIFPGLTCSVSHRDTGGDAASRKVATLTLGNAECDVKRNFCVGPNSVHGCLARPQRAAEHRPSRLVVRQGGSVYPRGVCPRELRCFTVDSGVGVRMLARGFFGPDSRAFHLAIVLRLTTA